MDEFIEPSMRKSQLTWDDLHLPAHLRETAQEVWDLLGSLVRGSRRPGATTRLDEIHAEYVARYAEAVALTYDHSKAEAVLAARKARDVQRATMQDLRRQLREAEQRATRAPHGACWIGFRPRPAWLRQSGASTRVQG